jgi:hypothetical protein
VLNGRKKAKSKKSLRSPLTSGKAGLSKRGKAAPAIQPSPCEEPLWTCLA